MTAALTLVALVSSAALAGRSRRPAAVLLAGVSVLWLLVNDTMEGAVLLDLTPGHGLTAADLAGLTGLLLAAALFAFPHRH